MLTSFSKQHKLIKSIVSKHWNILRNDRILATVLPERARVIFRGAPTLQSKIAPNIINPPTRPSFFFQLVGYHPCKKCTVCKYNISSRSKNLEFRSTVTGKTYPIKHFCTCSTKYVVYLITCPCGQQYVGRTIRKFSVRVAEHIALILAGDIHHTVPRHYKKHHAQNPNGTQFLIIDQFVSPWRGSPKTRGVSQLETFWIYELCTHIPSGLNVEWDINSFINKS